MRSLLVLLSQRDRRPFTRYDQLGTDKDAGEEPVELTEQHRSVAIQCREASQPRLKLLQMSRKGHGDASDRLSGWRRFG